jgi:hypothetical protein
MNRHSDPDPDPIWLDQYERDFEWACLESERRTDVQDSEGDSDAKL